MSDKNVTPSITVKASASEMAFSVELHSEEPVAKEQWAVALLLLVEDFVDEQGLDSEIVNRLYDLASARKDRKQRIEQSN